MNTYEEFEALCNRMDANLASEQMRQCSFMATLEKAIIKLSINRFPETEQFKHLFIKELIIQAHERAVFINEELDLYVAGYTGDGIEFYNENHVPKRDVSQEEKESLEKYLKTLPPEQHAGFIEIDAERVSEEAEVREFVFLCYDKAKELIVEYFPEIIDFSGNTIRSIDITAYQQMDEWVYDFYYYAGAYIKDYTY